MTDWELVKQGALVIKWLVETDDSTNRHFTLQDIWLTKFNSEYEGERVFNNSVLIMASYLFFVYIKENEYINLNYSNIDISNFKIISAEKQLRVDKSKEICRRVRNSIAHGKFEIINEIVLFEDNNFEKTDYIKIEIDRVKFGEFISNFVNEVFTQLVK